MALEAFLSALRPAPALTAERRGDLDVALAQHIERGRAAHKELQISDDSVAAVIGEVVAGDDVMDAATLRTSIEAVPADEVVLAVACARGDEAAIERFRILYMQDIPAIVRRVGNFRVDASEVTSQVNEKLFVAEPGGRPRILDLVARGSLSGLVRVIAVRTTLNLCRSERREITDPQDALATAIASQTDPELAAIKKDHRGAVKSALEATIGSLPPDERNLLRLSLLHRLSIDEIASLQRVHRSTAARRLARIRDQLGKEARRRLRAQLGASGQELEQVFRLVSSSLHISFERLLGS